MCAKFELLFISTFQIEKTHFEKLACRNCTDLLCDIYLLTCNQATKQPTNQQNPEVEKLLHTMQNLSCLCKLINGAVHHDHHYQVHLCHFLSLDHYLCPHFLWKVVSYPHHHHASCHFLWHGAQWWLLQLLIMQLL